MYYQLTVHILTINNIVNILSHKIREKRLNVLLWHCLLRPNSFFTVALFVNCADVMSDVFL